MELTGVQKWKMFGDTQKPRLEISHLSVLLMMSVFCVYIAVLKSLMRFTFDDGLMLNIA
jgi:hypothetical protein